MPDGSVKYVVNISGDPALDRAERDLIALGISVAAILLFVGTGGMVLPQVVRSWMGDGAAPDPVLVSVLLLNIALVIFGWRRYAELTQEIAVRRRAEELARQLAETDPLTGSLNRRSIVAAAEQMLEHAAAAGQSVAFVMVDLDNFKSINDLHGHQAGDRVLCTTADRIRALLPRGSLLARLGGDEFACIVPYDPRFPDRIDQFAGTLIERVGEPSEHDGLLHEITVSIGITGNLEDKGRRGATGDVLTLLHRADMAMYQAKRQGKNRHFWFEEAMESEMRFRSELETGIRRGIPRGEFVPFYEQQIDLDSGEISGFEMLARWQSPTLGLVGPEVFIPVAEEIGVIAELSESLIDQALAHARDWDSGLSLSVNISPIQLRDPWFAQKILKLLVKHNFPPNRLDIEITESCLHDNVGAVRSILTSLKNQGVTISLDDFGTGFSSLAQLRTLPVDRLKIDRSFVANLATEEHSDRLVRAIISLGDGLNLPMTAEGIEDTAILEKLRSIGRLKGQGYFYGRPESIEEVRTRLATAGKLTAPRVGPAVTQESGGGKRKVG